ncbi:MAG: tRNA (guanosine(37)-N1)-methyltransferase TrmD [Polyangiaceae bacterium]
MRIDVVTLFPELFEAFARVSFVGRAVSTGAAKLRFKSPRDHGLGNHRSVDDTPYGGGSGMVMRVDVLVEALEALEKDGADEARAHRVLLTPQGARFSQAHAKRFAGMNALTLVCGRYEGFDERVRHFVDEEVSLGDFVMTGGEVAAMAVIEATVRLLPGVLGNAASVEEESHGEDGLLEYPQYTRPVTFRGLGVPDVLAGGNHKKIKDFRDEERRARTRERRPDLWAAYEARQAALPSPPKRRTRAERAVVRPEPEGKDE